MHDTASMLPIGDGALFGLLLLTNLLLSTLMIGLIVRFPALAAVEDMGGM